MTLEQKIGQLLIVECLQEGDHQELFSLVEEGLVGSVLLKELWSKDQEIAMTTHLQKIAPWPLFIMQDCEFGFAMRVTDLAPYPIGGTMGHIDDVALYEQYGRMIALEGKALGVNFCLAPVCDVDSNPFNPIIGLRAFGSDCKKVGKRVRALVRGIQGEGLFATAKHYPGHGETYIDSHLSLPIIKTIKWQDMYPFHEAIAEGVTSVMVSHIAVEDLGLRPSSISKEVIGQLGDVPLIVTDDLAMGAIITNMSLVEAAKEALLAGNDLIMVSKQIRMTIAKIADEVPFDLIDHHLRRVLRVKERIQLRNSEEFPDSDSFKRTLYRELIGPQTPLKGSFAWIECGDEIPHGIDHLLLAVRQPQVRYQRLPLSEGQIAYIKWAKKIHPSVITVLFCDPYPAWYGDHIMAYENDPIAQEIVEERLIHSL